VAGIGKAWGKLLDIYTFSSMVARGITRDLMIPMYTVFVHLYTPEGMKRVWKILCWSFEVLATGKWPAVDAFGKPYPANTVAGRRAGSDLAGGYKARVWCLKGDLDYLAKQLHLRHFSSAHPCCLCPANSSPGDPLCWSEFRTGRAQWQSELWTNSEWAEANQSPHQLLQLSGVGIQSVFFDWMHVKHLGCDKYTYASVLHLLCYSIMPGDPAANMAEVWRLCNIFYKDRRPSDHYRNLHLSSIGPTRSPHSKFPKMRGKAAQVRHLGAALIDVWTSKMDRGCTQHRQIEYILRYSTRLEDVLDEHKFDNALPADVAREFLETTEKYLQLSAAVCKFYGEACRKLFDITPKHHMLWHCAFSAKWLNPRQSWCYMGEDHMQHMRRIAASSLHGTPGWMVGKKTLEKCVRGFTCRVVRRGRWFQDA
jgi:hypothetical protein